MRRRRRGSGLERALGAAAMAFVIAGCPSPEPVRIGVVVSGESVVGAQIAAAEINATGGIKGRPLALRVISGADARAKPAFEAAERLAEDPSVIGIVGHSNSGASLAGAQIYNAHHVVQIAPTSSAPLLSHAGPYTFRLVASDIHQARFLADQVVAGDARSRIAVFFVNDDYGYGLHEVLQAEFARRGVPVVYDAPYSEQDTLHNVAAIAQTFANVRPDLLIWLGRSRQLHQLLPALRLVTPGLRILASDGLDNAATQRNADGAFTGVRYVCFVDPSGVRPGLNALRARLLSAAGRPLTAEDALTYDAVMLLATAARAAGSERDAIRGYLASLGHQHPAYEGATGAIAFDANGDPRPSYCLTEITATGIRIVSRSPLK
jgi:branched-chain amino acid transport system substrate-binding protein